MHPSEQSHQLGSGFLPDLISWPCNARTGIINEITRWHGHYSRIPQDVKSDATFRIPVVDLSKFRTSTSKSVRRETADEIVSAFKEVGFVYLSEHGIPDDVVNNVFSKVSVVHTN